MNGPEKKVVYLAFCLFVLGVVIRILPWGLPTIDKFQVGDRIIVANEQMVSTDSISQNNANFVDKVKEKPRKVTKKVPKVQLPIHINSASQEVLCTLRGVGPKLAGKIIAHREAFGPFKNEKDLQKVPGIGKKKLESILPGVIFD